MQRLKDPGWWYWTATAVLLGAGLWGVSLAFPAAIGLTAIQIAHFALRTRSLSSFPVQIRIAYAAVLACGQLPHMGWLYWLPFVGTLALVFFGYCLAARILSLMPWNRRVPLSGRLVARAFLTPPVKGSFLDRPG